MLRPSRSTTAVAVSVCTLAAAGGRATAQIQYDTVALSGAAGASLGLGPNLSEGVNFTSFFNPSVNASGAVGFQARLAGAGVSNANDFGVFTDGSGAVATVAREGTTPGPNVGTGVSFGTTFFGPWIADTGDVRFRATLTGSGVTSENDSGIFSGVPGAAVALAREGDASSLSSPNLGAGVTFAGFGPINQTSAGHVTLEAGLRGTGIDSTNNEGIFTNAGGAWQVVARTGSAGPGPNVGPGVDFRFLDWVAQSPAGKTAFTGVLTGAGVDHTNQSGIFTTRDGTVAAVARYGSAGPGPDLGPGVAFSGFGEPRINDAGQVAFYASLSTGPLPGATRDELAIFVETNGSMAAVARTGPAGPGPNLGPGVTFTQVRDVALNAAGEVVFRAVVGGTGIDVTNDSGLFSNVGGGPLAAIARERDAAPGTGTGVVFSDLLMTNFASNTAGEIAFLAPLTGQDVVAANDTGLFSNAGGSLVKVAREGDLFDVDPGRGTDLRTILAISLQGQFGGFGGPMHSFNDSGVVAFTLAFTDGSSGVFTAVVPEPASLALLVPAAAATVLCRRRGCVLEPPDVR